MSLYPCLAFLASDVTKMARCFVIMPFSGTNDDHTTEYWKKQYDSFLKPLIQEIPGMEVSRSEALRGDILGQIIADLVRSEVVVADLTDANLNVYWELGVRQSFKHGTVTIAQEETRIPFDLSGKGTLRYYTQGANAHLKNTNFSLQFKAAIRDCLENPNNPDSHVLKEVTGR